MVQYRKRHRPQGIKNRNKDINQSFFPPIQTKLAIGKADDRYEKEADQVAKKVVNNSADGNVVQKTGEEEEQVQQKPLANTITTIQKSDIPNFQEPLQKHEDEEVVQTKGEQKEPVQKMEEEESVQAMEEKEPVQAMEEEEPVQAMEEEEVQAKDENTGSTNSSIEGKLRKGSGGSKMDSNTQGEMESGFGADFSNVNIHNDSEAAQMSQDIGAQAFTHGNDVYFNEGKYNPASNQGKHLLAHELTHTIQQGASAPKTETDARNNKNHSPSISGQNAENIQRRALTPTEERAAIASGRASFDSKSVRILQVISGASVDGDFGPLTATAISNFQTALGITDNGIINEATLDSMVQNRTTAGVDRHEHAIQLILDFYNIASSDTLAFRFNAAAITFDFANFRIIPARTDFEPGGLRVVNLSNLAFGSAVLLRDTIQGELAIAAPAVPAPGATPNRLSVDEVRAAISYTSRKYTDERSVRAIQGVVGAGITGIVDAQTVQFVAEAQSIAVFTVDGKVGDDTTKELYTQMVASGNFDSAIRLVVDYYSLGDDDNLLQIYYDPTIGANASTDFRPNQPVRIRLSTAGMAQSFEGLVNTIAHEMEHVKLLKQGVADRSTQEFLAESVEVLSINLPDENLNGYIDDATRCINNWDTMTVNSQIEHRRTFFAARRAVLRRIDGSTPVQQAAHAALRARYVAINPPR